MDDLITELGTQIGALMDALAAGEFGAPAWLAAMEPLLARYHLAAFMAASGLAELPAEMSALVGNIVEVQLDFLRNFGRVMEATAAADAPAKMAQWTARANLYAKAIKTSFAEGDVVRQVGRVLPLPAMPAQGTQCGPNCLCGWRVVTMDEAAGDYDAFWRRHAQDSCQTCVQREQEWSPVRIRGGRLLV